MTQKPDFQTMSRKELRAYVLSHRDDDSALRIYMDRLKREDGVVRHHGTIEESDLAHLSQLLQKSSNKAGDAQ